MSRSGGDYFLPSNVETYLQSFLHSAGSEQQRTQDYLDSLRHFSRQQKKIIHQQVEKLENDKNKKHYYTFSNVRDLLLSLSKDPRQIIQSAFLEYRRFLDRTLESCQQSQQCYQKETFSIRLPSLKTFFITFISYIHKKQLFLILIMNGKFLRIDTLPSPFFPKTTLIPSLLPPSPSKSISTKQSRKKLLRRL